MKLQYHGQWEAQGDWNLCADDCALLVRCASTYCEDCKMGNDHLSGLSSQVSMLTRPAGRTTGAKLA